MQKTTRENLKQLSEDSNNNGNYFKDKKSAIEWRREIVLKMLAGGHTQSEISRELKIHRSVVSLDVKHINEQCKQELRSFLEDKLPMEVKQARVSYNEIIKDAEHIIRTTEDARTKIQANHLKKETVDSRLELATHADIAAKVMDMHRQKKPTPEEEAKQLSEHYGEGPNEADSASNEEEPDAEDLEEEQ